jgi:hypothetical protein
VSERLDNTKSAKSEHDRSSRIGTDRDAPQPELGSVSKPLESLGKMGTNQPFETEPRAPVILLAAASHSTVVRQSFRHNSWWRGSASRSPKKNQLPQATVSGRRSAVTACTTSANTSAPSRRSIRSPLETGAKPLWGCRLRVLRNCFFCAHKHVFFRFFNNSGEAARSCQASITSAYNPWELDCLAPARFTHTRHFRHQFAWLRDSSHPERRAEIGLPKGHGRTIGESTRFPVDAVGPFLTNQCTQM